MSRSQVAFLGTGIMGLPMCRHLLRAGYPVRAWNRTAAKAASLAADGATLAASPAQAIGGAEYVVVMLSSGPVVTDLLFGDAAIADRLAAGATVIVMSSIPVETSREHAARLSNLGVYYIDAPVSGGEKGAIDATLTIMAGGEVQTVARAADVLATMGRVTHVGPVGCGQLAKLANQIIVGITIDAVAEALILTEAGGGDPVAVHKALLGGFADSAILRQHGERMITRNFVPGGKSEVQLKDLKTSRQLAESLDLDLPVLRLTELLYQEMCNAGHGQLDHSGLYLYLRSRNLR
jgi:3-hydroxyisobutyrate dehydrogenase-like beta-hydroxyacid dehydrogenase